MEKIQNIATKAGIKAEEIELHGDFKAKLKPALWERVKKNQDGQLILVTATNPTPAGEGKTTTSIGLTMAMAKLKQKALLCLREPSLGPVFGMKGGAIGGGKAIVEPKEDINLHFTGDIHAITAANNLLCAIIDNHIFQGNQLKIDPRRVIFKRAMDMNDRALREVKIALGGKSSGTPRLEGFNITAASEIMAILCLARDLRDLQKRLGAILVGYSTAGKPVLAKQLKAQGAMTALLRDALKPNLIQTREGQPVLVHGGPFANIAHGCNSLMATRLALKLAPCVITEAGFGADLGAEKFFDIKCRVGKLKPAAVVLVTTIKSLKYNGEGKLEKGLANLEKHVENIRKFKVPLVVAINHFTADTAKEIAAVKKKCEEIAVPVAFSDVWAKGGQGGLELGKAVLETIKQKQAQFKPLYPDKFSIQEKITKIAQEIYGARKVVFAAAAKKQMQQLARDGQSRLPVCIAKTQYSLSDNPLLLGRPENFDVKIRELRLSRGAGFVVALAGEMMTMPGLPKVPAAEGIRVTDEGEISGVK